MRVTAEHIPDKQVILQVELEEPEIEQHKQRAYRKLVQRAVIPGFRKGKAPRPVLERLLGADALLREGLDTLITESAFQAIQQEGLEAVADPQIEIETLEPLAFKATVPLRPTIDLGDYSTLRVPWDPPQVLEEEVNQVLETVRLQTTPWEPTDRPVQLGDLVTIAVIGDVEELSTASEEAEEQMEKEAEADSSPRRRFLDREEMAYRVQEDATYPAPGFPAELVGLEKGQTKEFTLTPPEDHAVTYLAGKPCRFTVTVDEVKEQRLPEMDDEWAHGVLEGYDSLADLEARVRADLETRAQESSQREYEEKVLEALKEVATIEYPPILVEGEIDRQLQDQEDRMRRIGLSLQHYLLDAGRSLEDLREEARPEAANRVVQSLLLSQLAEVEGLEVSEEEIQAEVDRLSGEQEAEEQREEVRRLFSNEVARETLRRRLLTRRTLDRLVSIAKGEIIEADEEEDSSKPAAEEPEAKEEGSKEL